MIAGSDPGLLSTGIVGVLAVVVSILLAILVLTYM